jgi:2-polyprenyl-3-methyl-5-hydroxy-6-metoxy-1,4-benzoquinol methylase
MNHRQTVHAALPAANHDESARQDYVVSLRQHLTREVMPGNLKAYQARVVPAFQRKHGRLPATPDEVRKGMTRDPYYQFWSVMQRASQEMIWDSVIDTVERHGPDLSERLRRGAEKMGSLRITSAGTAPRYHTGYDIHLQPGGYHSDHIPDDVAAGAIYDLGVPLYAVGMMGPENNATGDTIVGYYRSAYHNRAPIRILDMGCAIGNSTLPWARAFSRAEVHGIDVGAPCLRYGHLRANAMGFALHLSQQNAEKTDFESGSFDVIASALLFHETSRSAVGRIFRECYRLLKPGGVMLHFDGFRAKEISPEMEFFAQWEVYNNNEAFLKTLRDMDILGEVRAAGFPAERARFESVPYASSVRLTEPGTKGYMAGFGNVTVLVAEK